MLSQWLKKTINQSINRQCALCQLSIESPTQNRYWCDACLMWFDPIPRCERCGLPTLSPVAQCGRCLSEPPLWHRLYCVGDYQFPLNHYIHQLKYHQQFWQAKPLAALLAERISTPAPIISCVPLHWHRHLKRGFNQSERLAHHLSQQLDSQFLPSLFQRINPTPTQKGLNKQQRKRNLTNAFKLKPCPSITHIALVDDVVTTGSTLEQLCKLLLEVGVKRIDIYCICRTAEPES
jgi:ComF family protein